MWKLVIPALAVALTGCGGGGGGSAGSAASAIQTLDLTPTAISQYKNEIGSAQIFNSAVADLNGDGLDDIVLSGFMVTAVLSEAEYEKRPSLVVSILS